MKERHIFAGNNTASGFFSYFDFIINLEDANRIYILKGGPGVGKSSFMKKFGLKMQQKGHFVEYIHCSSDQSSLDGVIIQDLQIAIIDGTAPHIVDPKLPGVVDVMINLGDYLDCDKLEKQRDQIIKVNKNKSNLYKSAYRYFKIAGIILEEMNYIYDQIADTKKISESLDKMINDLRSVTPIVDKKKERGTLRKVFSEAYTASGYINYTKDLCDGKRVWELIGPNSNRIANHFEQIVSYSLKKGYKVECYYKPLTPDKIQHIYIEDLNLMIVSSTQVQIPQSEKVYDLCQFLDRKKLDYFKPEIETNQNLFDLIIKNALDELGKTKEQHLLLETIYVNAMDFDRVDQLYNSILSKYI